MGMARVFLDVERAPGETVVDCGREVRAVVDCRREVRGCGGRPAAREGL